MYTAIGQSLKSTADGNFVTVVAFFDDANGREFERATYTTATLAEMRLAVKDRLRTLKQAFKEAEGAADVVGQVIDTI